ncbi:hypothetical protein Chor_010857 [Crotalus horridus]
MAEGWREPRRALSVGDSLDLQAGPAVRAALTAAEQQRRRPRSLCAGSDGLQAPSRPRAGLLELLRLRSPRRAGQAAGPPPPPFPAEQPAAAGGVFLRGGSLWGSRRRGPPSGSLSSRLRKSFSFRLRRGPPPPPLPSAGSPRPARLRSRSEGDAAAASSSLQPAKRDSPGGGFWKQLGQRLRRRERFWPAEAGRAAAAALEPRARPGPLWSRRGAEPVLTALRLSGARRPGALQRWGESSGSPFLSQGIVGNLSSGKSALVHRYLTGTYVQEESPEGGRFKKEIVVDGQSYLLLIRDEGGPPELQFAAWVDAVVFVFSLEDEISFQTVYNYYLRLCSYRNTSEVPMVLVGTQDAISATNPRVIDDSRARKLSNDLKRCTYYETCATYGLNVERVFQDVAQKVVALRKKQQLSIGPCKSLPNSPSHSSVSAASVPTVHINQAANGGGAFSDYSSSVPSTPSISQRELRIETIAASNTPTPIRKQSKRRSNIFTVSPGIRGGGRPGGSPPRRAGPAPL